MEFPDSLKYTKEHEWLRIEEEKNENGKLVAVIGITDYAQSELGELVYVEVDTIDEVVHRDDVFGTVEAVKTTSELYMPVTGKILEFNSVLDETEGDDPGKINSDPYGEGWIVKIEIHDAAELEDLLTRDAYRASVE